MTKTANIHLPALTIIVGHYGVGKTNLALNLFYHQRNCTELLEPLVSQTLIDLDIVNPYYRVSDYSKELGSAGVRVMGPVYGATTLDVPSLMPGIDVAIATAKAVAPVIVDVGGDADGARALARYSQQVTEQGDCAVLYVVNSSRPEVAQIDDALNKLREIEAISGVAITHIVGNTHLKEHTDATTIIASIPYVWAIAEAAKLPIACITAPRSVANEVKAVLADDDSTPVVFPVEAFVGSSWEDILPLIG